MESPKLAALLSSLVSELLLLLLLLFPSPTPLSLSSNSHHCNSRDFNSDSHGILFRIIIHFLFSQEIATSLSLLRVSKKRKRTHLPEPDSDHTHEDSDHELGDRLSELMRVVRNPDSFKATFKMSSSTFEWLSGLLEPLLECRDPIRSPLNLSAELRLGIGLFRLATGSDYHEIACRFGITESATRFCARQLCRVLCTNFRFWVGFPTPPELELVSKEIEALTGLPNCCGVIDCTRFNLVKRNDCKLASDEKVQLDDSIAVQIVVDSSSRILSIVAGFRGDKEDSRVLKSTTLFHDIEGGRLLNSSPVTINGMGVNQYFIGDGGYPLLPWLMIPFVDVVPGSCEEKFNVANRSMRVFVLRTIASLKNWGVLSKPIEEEIKSAVALIGACSILHNVLITREDDSALVDAGDYSLFDQDSQNYYPDSVAEDNSIQNKASDVRKTLATKVAEFHEL